MRFVVLVKTLSRCPSIRTSIASLSGVSTLASPTDIDDRPRTHGQRLLGLDAGAAGPVMYIKDVAHVPEHRRAGEIGDVDGMPGNVAGDHAADADAPVDLARSGIVVDAANRARRQRIRIRRGFEHGDV